MRLRNLRIEVVFVDDKRIASLAGDFKGSPRATDVLSFCYDDPDMLDEIVISLDTARRQARERGVALTHELVLLCVHGFLHIAGFDDETFAEWRKMKRAEFETVMRIL